ncbi:MAG: cytochrome c peroxidase [Myxococcota bacterium]
MRCWRRAPVELLVLLAIGASGCVTQPALLLPTPPTLNADQVQRGAFVFRDARISPDGLRSCATCHPGGGSNGGVYRTGTEAEPGSRGARNVSALRGLWQTAPYLWDGSLPDARSAIERMLAVEMGGAALPTYDLDALEAYVLSFESFDRGRLEPDGTPVEPVTLAARRGAAVYLKAKCDECHPAPAYFVPKRSDVGTGMSVDVPTLRGVPSTPPYGHDGRWATLEEAVEAMLRARQVELSERERTQLVEYLKLF